MKIFSFAVVLLVVILFSVDPNTSLVADRIYELNHRDDVVSDDKGNKDKDKDDNEVHNGEHIQLQVHNGENICLQCKSHSLTLQPSEIDREEGQLVQSIECRDCGFQWKEIWTLPNWFWSKDDYYSW